MKIKFWSQFAKDQINPVWVENTSDIILQLNAELQNAQRWVRDVRFEKASTSCERYNFHVLACLNKTNHFVIIGHSNSCFQTDPTFTTVEVIDELLKGDMEMLDMLRAMILEEKYLYCIRDLELMGKILEIRYSQLTSRP